ncbi:PetM subunit of cytochrome b6f complex [Bathycoccus prasinos]|uniref:PetM subunit of cytochrome b6f complex n=1 Tax=Bathycoccus prasinos TaxID=41875 RepID=K8EZL4_9CHLO|nr:PetM subunit of cytochrome b6f complex [Bathycoccus prasinos]CCO17915.1 PetM subunit of cytochrome b6f complex [Bathycoccus prasinos]|eukprot:XP_007511794.1 PetM subunit of cytochrome b6f complex [Bathycoccus prasinos]
MALTLTASTVVASVKPTVSSNRRSSKVASFSKTVVSAPIVWYVSYACSLFYCTRSFVRSSFGKHNRRIKVFQTKFPKEEEDKNYTLCSFSFFLRNKRNVVQQKSRKSVATAALSPMEISQIADAAAEIGDVATTLFGCTLIGLALGFVLLRVESTVEGTD